MDRVGNRRMRRNVGKVNRPATAAVAAASRASKLRRKFPQPSASDALAKTPAKRPQTVLPKIRGNKGKSNKPREASTIKTGQYETIGCKIKNSDDAEKFFSKGVKEASKLRKAHQARKVYQRMQHYIDTKGHKTIASAYKSLDSDGQTGITLQEYKKFLDKAQLSQAFTPEEIEISFKFADRNGNGIIDLNEFVDVYSPTKGSGIRKNNENMDRSAKYERRRAHQHLDRIREKVLQKLGQKSAASTAGGGVGKALWGAYREMDKDGNGTVDYNEFKRAMGKEKFDLKLHPNDLHNLAVACDMNGDGTISAEEFVFTIMEAGFPDLHHYFQDQRKDVILRMNTLNEQQMKKATRFGNQPRFPLRPPPPKDSNLKQDGISIKPNKIRLKPHIAAKSQNQQEQQSSATDLDTPGVETRTALASIATHHATARASHWGRNVSPTSMNAVGVHIDNSPKRHLHEPTGDIFNRTSKFRPTHDRFETSNAAQFQSPGKYRRPNWKGKKVSAGHNQRLRSVANCSYTLEALKPQKKRGPTKHELKMKALQMRMKQYQKTMADNKAHREALLERQSLGRLLSKRRQQAEYFARLQAIEDHAAKRQAGLGVKKFPTNRDRDRNGSAKSWW